MITDTIISELGKVERKSGHALQLIQNLGNPSEWSYTGTVIDAGHASAFCACGHEIRYCFLISHPLRGQAQVGSTCIDHIAEISPALGQSLTEARERLEADLAAAQAKARHAAADAENQALWSEYAALRDKLIARFHSYRNAGQRAPYAVWYFAGADREKFRRNSPPTYTRACDLKKWLVRAIAYVRGIAKGETTP